MNILLFSIGAAIGAPLRFWIDCKFKARYKFPAGILLVNIFGSFLIGVFATDVNYLVLGFCGALTTWSTFIIDIFLGYELKNYKVVAVNLVASLVFGLLAAYSGYLLAS